MRARPGQKRTSDMAFEDCEATESPRRPLFVNFGSPACLDWCVPGSRQGDAGSHEHAAMVWLSERRIWAEKGFEDIAFGENTDKMPIHKIQQPLLESHHCVSVKVGGTLIGWPMERKRLFHASLSRSTMMWVGPDSAADVQRDFERWVRRNRNVDGSVFLQASEEEVANMVMDKAAARSSVLPENFMKLPMSSYLHKLGPVGLVQRKTEWDRVAAEFRNSP
eukprot:9496502-Pyramimonas_sp.AAC.1